MSPLSKKKQKTYWVCDCLQVLHISHDSVSTLRRRSWSRAPSGTLRAWGWQRLNMGTLSALSCMWPQVCGSPTRHLMSNLLDWVHWREEWALTCTNTDNQMQSRNSDSCFPILFLLPILKACLHSEGHMDDGLTLQRCQHEESRAARIIRNTTLLFKRFIR